jgi:hypothetical protein
MNESRKHFSGELTVCDACAEPIVFLQHERTGKLSPITVASYPNGNVYELPGHLYGVLGPDHATMKRNAGIPLRLNHFVNCPNKERFRR